MNALAPPFDPKEFRRALGMFATGVGGGTVAFLSMALMAMGAVLGLVARRRQRGRSF